MNRMISEFRLFPESASEFAPRTDQLFFFLMIVATFFTLLICILILSFVIKYRSRVGHEKALAQPGRTAPFEFIWTVIPLLIVLTAFGWGAELFIDHAQPPKDIRTVFVLGKQWMWRIQHPEGAKEVNQLHVALGKPVRLAMTSEDVIHSFFIPAFRTKQDVVPGRFSNLWFTPTKVGVFDLYCAEYCGTDHSKMIGEVIVLKPADMQTWLEGGPQVPLKEQGKILFEKLACHTCHREFDETVAPNLRGLFGRSVRLETGVTIEADETYIRDSIIRPNNHIVAGYQPNMPQYGEQLDEQDVITLIAYIRSLSTEGEQE